MNLTFSDVSKYLWVALEIIIIIALTRIAVYICDVVIDRAHKKVNNGEESPWVYILKTIIKYVAWITAILLSIGAAEMNFNGIFKFIEIDEKALIRFVVIVVKIVIIIILMKLSIKVLCRLTEAFFEKQKTARFSINTKKADTLSGLIKNMIRYVLSFIAVLICFDAAGINIRTFLAVTSVAGVAVGFGAQSLIKDVLSGFFILFEDQFAVGDYVTIGDMSGVVENVGLRITKIRDFAGDLYIIPNGSIDKVTNKSRGNMKATVDIDVDYKEDIDRVLKITKEVCDGMVKDCEFVVSSPQNIGISKINGEAVTIRVIAQTYPMKQGDAESEFRKRIKYAFDKNNIKMACPGKIIINQ